jgi:hypothetical protein
MANVKTVNTPSKLSFVIRETTGADEQILTARSESDAEMIDRYIHNVIISGPGEGKISYEDFRKLRLRDKYALLIHVRIFGLSPNLIFEHTFPEGFPEEFTINLEEFVWDYNTELPKEGEMGYSPYRIQPYEVEEILISLPSRELRAKLLDGIGEAYILGLKPQEQNINASLLARNLELKDSVRGWVKVLKFSEFSSKEMVAIRTAINKYDPPVSGEFEITNDFGMTTKVNLLSLPEFFYPAKI